MREVQGKAFSLRRFHDLLLSIGPAPPALAADVLVARAAREAGAG
jgi:uncharacterized protein (DUF885 family)